MNDLGDAHTQLKREFGDFLENDFGLETGQGKYALQLQDIIKQYPTLKRMRLEVDLQGEQF